MDKTKAVKIIPVAMLAGLTLINIWFLISHYWLIDSDMAQEMLHAKHLNDTGRIISADWIYTTELRVYIALSMITVDCLVFTLLNASYNSSYWIPAFVLIICLLVIRFKADKRMVFGVIVVFLLSGVATLKRNAETPIRGRIGFQETAGWLTENGYKRGYAQFWDADACVELSSGKLEIWSLYNLNDFWSLSWGQPLSHTLEIPDHPFIIVKKGEGFDEGQHPEYSVQYETERYVIYG